MLGIIGLYLKLGGNVNPVLSRTNYIISKGSIAYQRLLSLQMTPRSALMDCLLPSSFTLLFSLSLKTFLGLFAQVSYLQRN